MKFFIIVLAALATSACAHWGGQGELGAVVTRGNAVTETGNFKLDFIGQYRHWRHNWTGRVLYGRSNEVPAAERWETALQSEFKLQDKPFLFASARFEQDRFSTFAYQMTFSTGAGIDFVDTTSVKFSGSLGGGYRKLRPQSLVRDELGTLIERTEGEPTEDFVGKAGLNYRQQVTSNTTVVNKLLMETGADNTLTQNDFSVQVAMTERLALGVGHIVRHNAEPPEGQTKTDQLTTVNLVYKLPN